MQDNNQSGAVSGVFDATSGKINPYAPLGPATTAKNGDAAATVAGPFRATGWEKVGEGLVLIYLGTILAIVSVFATFLLAHAGSAMAGIGAFGAMLGGLAILVGQWMCRGVPAETGLRNGITVACIGFSYQWLTGVVMALNPWLHFGRDTLAAIRLTNGAAQLVAMSCFLWFLSGVARCTRDGSLLNKAKWLFNSFLVLDGIWLLSRLMAVGSTGHMAHHSHVAHHLQPFGGLVAIAVGLSIVGVMIAWLVAYVSLLKLLADKIDAER